MRQEIKSGNQTIVKDDITIKTKDGDKTIEAILIDDLFAVHLTYETDIEEPEFTLTHRPSGYAMLTGLHQPSYGYVIAKRLTATLSEAQKLLWASPTLDPAMSLFPKSHKNAVGKYLAAAKRCENNTETERMVGVFYRDREACERLRIKINPPANTLLDDKAIGSEKLTGSLIMGEIKLSE